MCWLLLLGQLACTHLQVKSGTLENGGPTTTSSAGVITPGAPERPGTMAASGNGMDLSTSAEPAPTATAAPLFADAAGVQFGAFRFLQDRKNHQLFDGRVLVQLWLQRDERWELVHRDDQASWSRKDLIPGHYLLEVIEIQQNGNRYPPNEDRVAAFDLEAGTTANIELIVKKVPWGTVIMISLAVVIVVGLIVAAILLQDDLGKMDLRPGRTVYGSRSSYGLPPPPRVNAPAPRIGGHGGSSIQFPSIQFVVPRVYTSVDLFFPIDEPIYRWNEGDWIGPGENPMPGPDPLRPHLTGLYFPAPDEPTCSIRIVFDRAMLTPSLAPGALVLLDQNGQSVAGGVYMVHNDQEAVFHPLRPLAPGEYRMIVRGRYVYDAQQHPLEQTYERRFRMGGISTPVPGSPDIEMQQDSALASPTPVQEFQP